MSRTCVNTSTGFAIYSLVYLLGILCSFPALITVVFGWLTYRNVRRIRVLAEQHVDRQMVIMTLIQAILVVISLVPLGIYSTYTLITEHVPKDGDRKLKEHFASTVVNMTTYLFYVVCLLHVH